MRVFMDNLIQALCGDEHYSEHTYINENSATIK